MILYLDNHLLALNKPPGLLTQPSGTEEESLESWGKEWIRREFGKPGGVFLEAVHRLDRLVSGVVLFARTSKALSRLHLQSKIYLAWVEGDPGPEGALEHYLLHGDHRAELASAQTAGAKRALLHYKRVERRGGASLLEIELVTGRYHQIRAQFSAIGSPILGDQKYGATSRADAIALHHRECRVAHPTREKTLLLRADTPSGFGL